MKIRLMGSPDLVRAWGREIAASFGASVAEYPCRGSNDIRAYCDIDDRVAAAVAFKQAAPVPKAKTIRAPRAKAQGKG